MSRPSSVAIGPKEVENVRIRGLFLRAPLTLGFGDDFGSIGIERPVCEQLTRELVRPKIQPRQMCEQAEFRRNRT